MTELPGGGRSQIHAEVARKPPVIPHFMNIIYLKVQVKGSPSYSFQKFYTKPLSYAGP